MSSFLTQARVRALKPVSSLPRPRLTVVPRLPQRTPRVPFVLLVVTLLAAGLVGLLLLNTALQRGAYVATDLRMDSAALVVREQKLELQVAKLAEPQRVAQEAQRLGMVQNDSPAFLSLSTGRIVGTPVAGEAAKQVDVSNVNIAATDRVSKIVSPAAGQRSSETSGPIVVAGPDRPQGADSGSTGTNQ